MTVSPGSRPNEKGYALVAAVAAVAVFACLAFMVLATNQGAIALAAGRAERARLMGAADAGVALAIHTLGAEDRHARWSLDGGVHEIQFGGVALTVTVEDELGKAPLNALNDLQVRALFAGAGAKDAVLDALVTEFRQWVTPPPAPAPGASGGSRPARPMGRGGPMLTVEEVALLRDVTPEMFARIAPVTTVFPDDGGTFRPERAQPLARATMAGEIATSHDQAEREPSIVGQRPDVAIADSSAPIGDPLTVRVTARDRDGGVARRVVIVEFTGDRDRPYWIRYAD